MMEASEVPLKLFNKETEDKLKAQGILIVDLGLASRPERFFAGCNWWVLEYKFLRLSTYYDPIDALGSVNEPYYEFYDGDETMRFLPNEEDDYIKYVFDIIKKHSTELEKNPENFL